MEKDNIRALEKLPLSFASIVWVSRRKVEGEVKLLAGLQASLLGEVSGKKDFK